MKKKHPVVSIQSAARRRRNHALGTAPLALNPLPAEGV
jgi:hypothetical protein